MIIPSPGQVERACVAMLGVEATTPHGLAVCAYMTRTLTKMSYPEIAKFYAASHSTVRTRCKRIEAECESDRHVKLLVDRCASEVALLSVAEFGSPAAHLRSCHDGGVMASQIGGAA